MASAGRPSRVTGQPQWLLAHIKAFAADVGRDEDEDGVTPSQDKDAVSRKRKADDDEDFGPTRATPATSGKKSKLPKFIEEADEGGDEDNEEVEDEGATPAVARKAAKAPRAKSSSDPSKKAFSKKARTEFEKQLKSLPHEQLAAAVTSFLFDSPSSPGALELLSSFKEALPCADSESLLAALYKARRGIDKAQPRYANGDHFAFKRCSSAIGVFKSLVASQASSLVQGSQWSAIVEWAVGAAGEIGSSATFYMSDYKSVCYGKIQAALKKAVASGTLDPRALIRANILVARWEPKPAVAAGAAAGAGAMPTNPSLASPVVMSVPYYMY